MTVATIRALLDVFLLGAGKHRKTHEQLQFAMQISDTNCSKCMQIRGSEIMLQEAK